MRISLAGRRLRVDLPHAAFVTAIALYTAWYLHDAHAHSDDFSDFLLIEPVGIAVFVFWLLILRTTVVVEPPPLTPAEGPPDLRPEHASGMFCGVKPPQGGGSLEIGFPPLDGEGQGGVHTERRPLTKRESVRIFGTMALLTLYVIALRWVGFDIGTFVYVAATLRLLGERRIWVLVLVPLALCAAAIYLFNVLLEMPLPLALGAYL